MKHKTKLRKSIDELLIVAGFTWGMTALIWCIALIIIYTAEPQAPCPTCHGSGVIKVTE